MKEIAYQNKDIISKTFVEQLKDKSLNVYGLNLPKIKQALPTNLPAIEANELRLDNLFLLEDNTLALIDYESVYSEKNKLKYLGYVHRVLKRYFKEHKEFAQIRIVIIYTADVEPDKTNSTLDIGCLKMILEEAFLSQIKSEQIMNKIQRKIQNREKLSEEEMMQLIILPLTYKGRKKKVDAIQKVVELSKEILEEESELFVLTGLFVFTDKVIDHDTADQIIRRISMTKIGRIIEENTIAAAKEAAKENAKDNAMRMLKTGKLTIEEVASCVPTLTMDEIKELEKMVLMEQKQ